MKNMKNRFKIALSCLVAAFAVASCVDNKSLYYEGFIKPYSVVDIEFLNNYDALKTYVDRSANPNFKLGASTSISDLTDKGVLFRLISTDFDQVTVSGMTQGAIVADNGAFNFGNIPALLTVASDAGLSVFGHTLVGSTNQSANYMKSLLADDKTLVWNENGGGGGSTSGEQLVNGDFSADDWSKSFIVQNGGTTGELTADGQGPNGKGRALKATNPSVHANAWESQMIVKWDTPMLEGEEWEFKMDYKSDATADIGNQAQAGPGNYVFGGILPTLSFNSTWQHLDTTIKVTASQNITAISFDLGLTATNYYFANVSLYKKPTLKETEMLTNGDFEQSDDWSKSFVVQNGGSTGELTADGQGAGGKGRALKVTNPSVHANTWESQMIVKWDTPMLEGETWTFKMDYKSDAPATFGNQAQAGPGNYVFGGILPDLSSTSTWQHLEATIDVKQSQNITAISFDLGLTATNYYFDNVSLIQISEDVPKGKWDTITTPKTPEQKYKIVNGELDRWIGGIMGVAAESVKDWTVVSEPMDDKGQLQTGEGKPDTEFYWQDYLGRDYARIAVQLARQYGGNDLKLFVNDNNLVNTAKCQGLIDMIKYWEGDNATKIDGISAQLDNLIYSYDAKKQKTNEDAIVSLFTKLKDTGKLIRIALDMRAADELGLIVKSADVGREQQLAMSRYYNFVIRKYFEIIPAAQRYGITLNPMETTTNSGLWFGDFSRKFTFSGVADGLAGRDVTHE